jgi:hypothetical protein
MLMLEENIKDLWIVWEELFKKMGLDIYIEVWHSNYLIMLSFYGIYKTGMNNLQ